MNIYTIPPSKPFLRTLAGWVLAKYGKNALAPTKIRILLPGRRACRTLQEAFLDLSGGKPMLLPRIEPIGEISTQGIMEDGVLPPPISPIRRQLLLMQLIAEHQNTQADRIFNMQKAAELATDLTGFMDEVAREELDYNVLEKLVPENLNEHWQQTLEFLKIISVKWPRVLEQEGVSDPVVYRNYQLRQIAKAWQEKDPGYPVIAAGSTGSQPATAALLGVIARLPQGRVILPGLDKQMEKKHWDAIGETHPQYLLCQLLEKIRCKREAVQDLESEKEEKAQDICLRQVFLPATGTASWKESTPPLKEGLSHIHILETQTLLEEARLIGVLLREILEIPGKTAALITPDRTLASMVTAQMQRFAVELDDSAGRSLKTTPAAVFMRLVAKVASSSVAPVDLLALLRHPLAAAGLEAAACRELSRELEMQLLRGVRMQSGFFALIEEAKYKCSAQLIAMLEYLQVSFAPLLQALDNKKPLSIKILLEQHIACAQKIAATPEDKTGNHIWAKESGNHLANWLAELLAQADALAVMDPFIYPATFDALLAGQTYWPQQSKHPRLFILSPIEARLQCHDRVILGSMNEGVWPADVGADPWMSRPMRSDFGLPLLERSLGQAAHDIDMLARAPEVFFTRARKIAGHPSLPSRWLVRLQTLVEGKDKTFFERMKSPLPYQAALEFLDEPESLKELTQPAPTPPVVKRPRNIRVTRVDTWIEDPYRIYAEYMLGLKALHKLDREPDGRDFGVLVHEALQRFTSEWPDKLPQDAYAKLIKVGREVFKTWLNKPAIASLWWPRFEQLAVWLIEQESVRREGFSQVLAEVEGQWEIKVSGGDFTLTTRIDRMEIGKDGRVALVDYKTGSADTKSSQLPLEALVVQHGKLKPEIKNIQAPTQLEYWKLASRTQDCKITPLKFSEADIENTQHMLVDLINRFDRQETPYTATESKPSDRRFNDYEHLTRRAEWEAL